MTTATQQQLAYERGGIPYTGLHGYDLSRIGNTILSPPQPEAVASTSAREPREDDPAQLAELVRKIFAPHDREDTELINSARVKVVADKGEVDSDAEDQGLMVDLEGVRTPEELNALREFAAATVTGKMFSEADADPYELIQSHAA